MHSNVDVRDGIEGLVVRRRTQLEVLRGESLADPETLVPGVGVADHDYGPGLQRALELE